MSFETLYLAGVLIAFTSFFVTVTAVWFVNRLPDKPARKPIVAQATSARRPDPVERKLAA